MTHSTVNKTIIAARLRQALPPISLFFVDAIPSLYCPVDECKKYLILNHSITEKIFTV
jgi:hypothetical protein